MEFNDKITKAIVAIICITPLIIIPFALDIFYYPKILFVYVTLVYMSINCFLHRSQEITNKSISTNDKIIVIYLILIMISTALSSNVKTSLYGRIFREEGLFAISAYILLFLFSSRYYQKSNKHINFYLISVSIVALYGIIQYFGLDPIPRDFMRYKWSGRAFSTIGNPNFLGAYLVLALPIFMFLYIHLKKSILLFITLLTYFCLLCTSSRGAWIGFFISVVTLVYYVHKLQYSRKHLLLTLGFMVAITILFNLYNDNAFVNRLLSIFGDMNKVVVQTPDLEEAGSSRIFIWTRVLEMIKNKPLWGVGLETLDMAFLDNYKSDIINYFGREVFIISLL